MPRQRTGSAYENKGLWYGAITLREGQRYTFRIPDRKDGRPVDRAYARAFLAELWLRYEAGEFDPHAAPETPEELKAPAEIPTVAAYARTWIATQSYTTVKDDARRIERYLGLSVLGAMRLDQVRPRHIVEFIEAIARLSSRRGGTLAPRSVRNIYSVVQRVFARAVLEDRLPTTPCGLTAEALPEIADKQPGERSTWKYTRGEVERLLSDPQVPVDRRVLYGILFLTGCRLGEAAALRWRDYDDTKQPLGELVLARSIERVTRREKGTKTGAIKHVPVHPVLARLLTQWRDEGWTSHQGRSRTDEDYIVPNKLHRPRGVWATNASLRRDCEHLAIRPRHQHATRHTFAGLARDDGARGEILRWITHAPPKAVFDQYAWPAWETLCTEIVKLRITTR